MEASASTSQHTFAHRPQGMNTQAQGLHHQPAQGHYGPPGPGEQQHHQLPPQHQKPFFYVQPPQPYAPMQNMQWHMPVSYNPYYGYPGMSYGMPAMNPYPMNAYMDPPGYVMPQTHLHLMDYRRMLNPHYYQTLAYHSRRLHYQHSSPGRDMISSEVQTEPLSVSQKSSASAAATAYGGKGEAHNGFPDGRHNCPERNFSGSAQPPPQASSVKTGDRLVDLKKTHPPSSIEKVPQKSSFVIQTEEVRIECCSTAVGLEVRRSRDTQESALAHRYAAQDLAELRCSSVIAQSPVLQEVVVSAHQEQSDNSHQACPDILLVGTASCGSSEGTPSLHETKESGSRAEVCGGETQKTTVEQGQKHNNNANVSHSSNDGHFKVLHMPFDLDYLDELQSMETTVWSMEETCVPSSDWMMETLVAEGKASCEEDLIDIFCEEGPMEQVVPMIEMPQSEEEPLIELGSTGDAPVVALASPSDGEASADVCVTEVASMAHKVHVTGGSRSPSSELVVGVPSTADAIQRELNDLSRQETSFESLPAYLPSTAWSTDFRNVLDCSKVPQAPQKHGKSQSTHASEAPIRRRKLNLESKELHAVQRPKAEKMYKNKIKVDRRSLSDHECCLRRNLNQNAFPARRPRGEHLCTRCLANRSSCLAVSPGPESQQIFKRKSLDPLQPWLQDCVLPTCEACRMHTSKRLMRHDGGGSSSDICGPGCPRNGGETSENSSCRTVAKWWAPDDPKRGPANSQKRHQMSTRVQPERCPVALYPKLREKNCACDEHRVPGWEGLHRRPRGNAIQEMNEENVTAPVRLRDKWGSVEKRNDGYKWKNEKSFTSMVFNHNMDGPQNGVISQHLNVQKKSQPRSQGMHRKDTRC